MHNENELETTPRGLDTYRPQCGGAERSADAPAAGDASNLRTDLSVLVALFLHLAAIKEPSGAWTMQRWIVGVRTARSWSSDTPRRAQL